MDSSSGVQTPLLCKRKRVDNYDIEKRRIANYEALWRVLEGYLTELGAVLDSYISGLSYRQQLIDALKGVVMIEAGNSNEAIKEKESEQKPFNRNGGQVEQRRHDKYVFRQSGKSSYNVATDYEALKKEIVNFIERVVTFIKEVNNCRRSFSAREKKYKQDLASIMEIVKKTHEQK